MWSNYHVEHIYENIIDIYTFIEWMSFDDFVLDKKTIKSVERCLETLCQSVKDLWDEVYKISSNIEWKDIAWMRDVLAHSYLYVSYDILWDIIINHLPQLKESIEDYMWIW